MSFVSYKFFAFLAILIILYYLLPKRVQWMLLLVGSLVFYAFSGPQYLIFMAVTIVTTYGAGVLIERVWTKQDAWVKENKGLSRDEKKAYKASMTRKAKLILVLCLLANLGVLAVIKYTDFFLENLNNIFGTEFELKHFLLPLGISFYMFQSLGYVIDVYRRKYAAEKNIAKMALFTSFFPQVIQGPISRFDDLSQTLFVQHSFNSHDFYYGFQRAAWGFFKKLVIADRLAPVIITLTADTDQYPGVYVLANILFYALQLYADFTGGIDITIGVARMLGIRVTENFERPFFSKNIAEYWRRWHITMGTWFKDYIFYPLSVSGWMLKVSKWSRNKLGAALGKRVPVYIATIVVWFATGIWHGAAWNFIVWGMINCLVLLVSQELAPLYRRFHDRFGFSNTKFWDCVQIFRTFWLMGLIRILDVYRDVPLTFKMVGSMFTTGNWDALSDGSFLKLGASALDFIVVGVGVLIMFIVSFLAERKSIEERMTGKTLAVHFILLLFLILAVVVFGAYGIGYDATQFIYNQF
ncbi:MAG: MBOAT family protein [Eubacterium sp.]|nr:MBOAT family protein [Eubacterium sp.]